MDIKVMDYVKEAWEIVKADVPFFMVATLLVGLVGSCSFGILMGPLYVGLIMAIMMKMNGAEVSYGLIFNLGFSKFVPSLVALIIPGAVGGALNVVLHFIPCGFIFGYLCSLAIGFVTVFALYIIADEDAGSISGVEAIKKSVEMVKENLNICILFYLVFMVLCFIGCLACGIGIIVTAPIGIVMTIKLYAAIKAKNEVAAPSAE